MSFQIDLSGPITARVEHEAKSAGVSPAELLADIVRNTFSSSVDAEEQKQLNAPSVALLESWLAEAEKPRTSDEQTDAEEDIEDLMRSLNAPRREAGERLHFPGVPVTKYVCHSH